jgi:hypothetical protein
MQYPSTLLLKFSVRYVHPNYLFYCFNCVGRVCPNLSSAPCRPCSLILVSHRQKKIYLISILSLFSEPTFNAEHHHPLDCMYEPNAESAYLTDCLPRILAPVQILAYGLPALMLFT